MLELANMATVDGKEAEGVETYEMDMSRSELVINLATLQHISSYYPSNFFLVGGKTSHKYFLNAPTDMAILVKTGSDKLGIGLRPCHFNTSCLCDGSTCDKCDVSPLDRQSQPGNASSAK